MMTRVEAGNAVAALPSDMSGEVFEALLSRGGIRIERIVSRGHASPPGFWYDQDQSEWVLLLCGAARLEFQTEPRVIELVPGSYVNIPAGARHRVAWTDPDQPTVWVAVWYEDTGNDEQKMPTMS